MPNYTEQELDELERYWHTKGYEKGRAETLNAWFESQSGTSISHAFTKDERNSIIETLFTQVIEVQEAMNMAYSRGLEAGQVKHTEKDTNV